MFLQPFALPRQVSLDDAEHPPQTNACIHCQLSRLVDRRGLGTALRAGRRADVHCYDAFHIWESFRHACTMKPEQITTTAHAPALAPQYHGDIRVIVFSSLFPNRSAPAAGVFIKERMFRVARQVPIIVVAPQPWSPFDALLRRFRKSFRPVGATHECVDGIEVYRPRYFSVPAFLKRFDGRFMAIGCLRLMRRLQREFQPTLIDAHFLYPTGYAASIVANTLGLPLTITLRGSVDEWLINSNRKHLLRRAMSDATHLIAVSQALKENVAVALGQPPAKVTVVGNGVDLDKFMPIARQQARAHLNIADDAVVILGIGGLIERKGFHRVIPIIRTLRRSIPKLRYLIVGGGFTQGDMRTQLEELAIKQGVADIVQFCGPQLPSELQYYYSAADVFALATAHEGWANVFLEALACGIPIVTTRVGGNAEVIPDERYGLLVDYWDAQQFEAALLSALTRHWDQQAILTYARMNAWPEKIERLMHVLKSASATQR